MDQRHRFACDDCSKSFRRRPQLTTHLLAHKGIRPTPRRPPSFDCTHCPISFGRWTDLAQHLRLHGTEQRTEGEQVRERDMEDPSPHKVEDFSKSPTKKKRRVKSPSPDNSVHMEEEAKAAVKKESADEGGPKVKMEC
ncbi:hypothetical protein HK104_006527 [Borealophlyctis nickersoniae]|nr:hypothetical protein HK104_006527 [Borealophlyctis nickersoniae]